MATKVAQKIEPKISDKLVEELVSQVDPSERNIKNVKPVLVYKLKYIKAD